MDTTAAVPVPKPFMPHPNFSDEVNRNIVQSEIEGGVYLDELCEGAVLEASVARTSAARGPRLFAPTRARRLGSAVLNQQLAMN